MKKKTIRKARSEQPSAKSLVAAIALRVTPTPDLGDLLDDTETESIFVRLTGRMAAELSDSTRKYVTGLDNALKAYEQLRKSLPEAQWRVIFNYVEGIEQKNWIERDAAYLVGVAVGRRLGGGAR